MAALAGRLFRTDTHIAIHHPRAKELAMWRRFLLASLLVFIPSLARSQEAPERILPAGTQIYLHWDGVEKHRGEFDKTGLGKMLNGDTGKFFSYVVTYVRKNLEVVVRDDRERKE